MDMSIPLFCVYVRSHHVIVTTCTQDMVNLSLLVHVDLSQVVVLHLVVLVLFVQCQQGMPSLGVD